MMNLAGLILLLNVSCTTVYKDVNAMPVEPDWQPYTRQPIIQKIETDDNLTNFVVSDEFIKKAAQEHRFIKKVKRWKAINSIP